MGMDVSTHQDNDQSENGPEPYSFKSHAGIYS
jgi:hypothetical protein